MTDFDGVATRGTKDYPYFWLLAVITLLVYLPGLNGPFIYDDLDQILYNAKLHQLTNIKDILFCDFRQLRVLQNLSFALNWVISPGHAAGFKLSNVILHILNGFLVFRFLKKLVPERRFICLLATAIFLLHPLQMQSVTYVMGRISLIEFFFKILILNLLSGGETTATATNVGEKPFLVFLILVISLLGKESDLLLPLFILAYYMTIKGLSLRQIPWRRYSLYLGAMVFFIPFSILLTEPTPMYNGTVGFSFYPPVRYFVTQLYEYFFYLYLFFNPSNQSIFHPFPPFSVWVEVWGTVAFIICSALTYYAVRYRLKNPVVAFFILFFFLSMASTNSFLQLINPFAEYRLYSPNLALAVFTACGFQFLIDRSRKFRVPARIIAGALLIFWGAATVFLNTVWADSTTIVEYGYNLYPDSAFLAGMVGGIAFTKEDYEKAAKFYVIADNLNQQEDLKTLRYRFNLADTYFKLARYEQAEKTLNSIADTLAGRAAPMPYYSLKLNIFRLTGRGPGSAEYEKVLNDAKKIFGAAFAE